jgi:hypothetical protein
VYSKAASPDASAARFQRLIDDNVLLADPKERYDQETQLPKVETEHRAYGKVLILYLQSEAWMTVEYDERKKKAILGREFRLSDMAGH